VLADEETVSLSVASSQLRISEEFEQCRRQRFLVALGYELTAFPGSEPLVDRGCMRAHRGEPARHRLEQ
jgi:hypothetical protein